MVMNDKEKLVELIASKACGEYSPVCDEWQPHDCGKCYANDCHISEIADHLIAYGVTVQESNCCKIHNGLRWIPVTERLPEVGKQVLTVDKWGHIRNRKLYAYMSGHLDFQPDGLKPGADIIYWADIPEPPEGWVYSTYSYPCYQRKPKPPEGE